MTERALLRGRAWTAGSIQEDVVVVIEEGRFTDVRFASRYDDPDPNLDGGVMVPGFIDAHVHGGAGSDFMDGDEDSVRAVCRHHLRHGTLSLAATTLSGSRAAISTALGAIQSTARSPQPGEAGIVGVNLEGPYLNREKAGAQDPGSLRSPDAEELAEWLKQAPDLPWIMTVAPELPGVLDLIRQYEDRICFSIGHTLADYGQTAAAIEAGATHVTHLFNAMPPLHHREPGVVGAALTDPRCTVELIADGIHVHPRILHLAATLLEDRGVLVTDAMRACGMPEGTYRLYEHEVEVRDGAARLKKDGALAGSVLTMREAVRNMVEMAGLPIETVLPFATEVPARILGIEDRKGRIRVGWDADLLVLTPRFEIARVIHGGRSIA